MFGELKAHCCSPETTSLITHVWFRPFPASLGSSLPGAPPAASVCCYVAAGEEERCDELWETSGVCVHGDGGNAWIDQPQTEGPAHSGFKSKGEQNLLFVWHTNNVMLLLFTKCVYISVDFGAMQRLSSRLCWLSSDSKLFRQTPIDVYKHRCKYIKWAPLWN